MRLLGELLGEVQFSKSSPSAHLTWALTRTTQALFSSSRLVSLPNTEIQGRNVDLKWLVEVERLLVPISSMACQAMAFSQPQTPQ
jgi:hypothetical protein